MGVKGSQRGNDNLTKQLELSVSIYIFASRINVCKARNGKCSVLVLE